MSERSSKRRKLVQRGEDGYMPGNIVDIELRNFMTFEYLKAKPGPRLNIVVGPNGSGKSSLVCAIALGLAGEPQLLGRAANVGAYVKRGEESGYINISLRGDRVNEEICIMRKIDVRNKSEWLLNGKPVSKRDIIEIIQRFNIQVNNLTQFLPQDRVCEFAKLTPIQLLEETEKAVGDPELPVQHSALVDKSREWKRLEVTVKQNRDTLNQLKALHAEQENDVERFRLRGQLLQKVELMKKKVPWLQYDMKKAEYLQAKENEKNSKKNLDEAAGLLNDLNVPIEEKKQEKLVQEQACKEISDLIAQNNKKLMEILHNERCLGVQVQSKYDEMEELRKQVESRKDRILRAKEDLAAAELELANLPVFEPPKDELDNLRAQILELEYSARQKKLQKIEKENLLAQKKGSLTHCSYRLKEMESANTKLLHALKNSGSDKVVEAYNWLQSHRGELRKEAYGPVLLEVNVPDQRHAAYLENHVAYYIWKSFVTQDPADRDFLIKNLMPFDIPVLNYVGGGSSKKVPFQISEEMHRLGVYSRLDQIFDAPGAVKEVLLNQSGLEYSYIGSSETDQKADKAPQLGISDLWTPDNHYRWSKSRYGGHISASVEAVTPSRLLLCSLDAGEIERLKFKKKEFEDSITGLEESLKALLSEQRQLEDEAAKLHRQREEIVNSVKLEKKKHWDMENIIDQRRRKLESLEKENDLETNTQKLIHQAEKFNKQRFQFAIDIKNLLIEVVSFKRSFAEMHMRCTELDAKIKKMKQHLKTQEDAATVASSHFQQCKKVTDKCKEELSVAKSNAESIAVITPELTQAFIEMPSTLEDLEAAIQDVTSQANSILLINHDILEAYETRQQKIKSISMKLEADEKELSRCLSQIDVLKEKWLPTLRNLVLKINQTFSHNFCEMAVAGEVSLDEHEMDFDKYGILIRVKFREAGQLQVLSAHHQSGGERSVSTILYLVSLQDLTNCPFRVVDEINQGMDPINERKMFQQLVRAASQPNTPQCFLLTPKLLPSLEYSDECSILNMMTGPWIGKPSEVWSTGDCYGVVVRRLKGLNDPQEDV